MQKYPSALGFLIQNNNILLLLRRNTGRLDGYYVVPSSVIAPEESLRTAVLRAIYETVGVQVHQDDAQLVHVHSWKSEFDEESAHICFLIKAWHGEPFNKQPEKHAEMRWFPLDSLPSNVAPRARQDIQMSQKGILYSESGWSQI